MTYPFVRLPDKVASLGDHLRQRRLTIGQTLKQAGRRLGVTTSCLTNWEHHRSQPSFHYLPRIIRYLGYNPIAQPRTLPERLVWVRRNLGLTQEQAARRLRVDPSTLARWERGERMPAGVYLKRVQSLFMRV